MPHGFDSDSKAIDEIFRRLEHIETQLKVHAENSERGQGFVKEEMSHTRKTIQELHAGITRMHSEIVNAHGSEKTS